MYKFPLSFLFVILSFTLTAQIPFGSSWKYLDNGSDQGTAWRSLSFDDAAWKTGTGKFGYGISDAATVISYGPNASNKYVTTYFRKVVNITNPSATASFTFNVKRDDGVVVYVNGKEVYRNKVPTGTITYSTLANSGGDGGLVPKTFTVSNSAFVSGNNIIAVEIHIEKPTTTLDMAFDLELTGGSTSTPTGDVSSPVIQSINRQSPTTESTSATSVVFRATFSEPVSGVDVPDFNATTVSGTVNGNVTGLTAVGTGSNTYDVTVGSITGSGVLRLDLRGSGTNIQDAAGNAISGGFTNGQSYTIGAISGGGDVTAPTVLSIQRYNPSTQNTTATSVVFRTTFSEAVTGVSASDFSVSRTNTATGSITSVSGSGTTYDVTVGSISGSGSIRLDLNSSGTGIQDAAGNAISGGFTSGESYTVAQQQQPTSSYGFSSVSRLSVIPLKDATQHKPQAKAWKHADKWWCALGSTSGFKVYRLDGTTWKDVMTLSSNGGGKADVRVDGDLVHILVFKGASTNSYIASLQYDAASGTYKQWGQRSSHVSLPFPEGCEVATLALDTKDRMWVTYDGLSSIMVRYSDAPYTNWSSPITIDSYVKDDDVSAMVPLPSHGKIGVFWSDQRSKRFGFRTHIDGSDPSSWSTDEVPASQSALNVSYGMADDHLNVAVASDGTMYCAVKTSYNTSGYPRVALLVRRPSGSWDNLYPVTMGDSDGTQPIVVLNEALGKVKVVYGSVTYGGDIMYKESSTSSISFGAAVKLMDGGGTRYNYATSTHQTYNPEVVIIAMDITTSPWQTVSVIASDATSAPAMLQAAVDQTTVELRSSLVAYPNPFSGQATVTFSLEQGGEYSLSLYDMKGTRLAVLKRGQAAAGQLNTVRVDGSALSSGFYLVRLETKTGSQTLKMILKK